MRFDVPRSPLQEIEHDPQLMDRNRSKEMLREPAERYPLKPAEVRHGNVAVRSEPQRRWLAFRAQRNGKSG
jgi:hypothetical protein